MTPAAQYAQKREEAIELIRAHAPERLQNALVELLHPAIALSATRAEDSEIPIGASKFGTRPMCPQVSSGRRGTKNRSVFWCKSI
ncbi:MAG TPA: hypothetical protein VGB45_10075 [Abditibacterium sp.]|jgi:hypothetical protein